MIYTATTLMALSIEKLKEIKQAKEDCIRVEQAQVKLIDAALKARKS